MAPRITAEPDAATKTRTRRTPSELSPVERLARSGVKLDEVSTLLDGLDDAEYKLVRDHLTGKLAGLIESKNAHEQARDGIVSSLCVDLKCEKEFIISELKKLLSL